jgi:small subunit ribosomal protein S15
MAVTKQQKQELLAKFSIGNMDTGSSEVQVALLTARIADMTNHFNKHKKDVSSRRGLTIAVNRRRKLLDYLKNNNEERYAKLIKELDIRR